MVSLESTLYIKNDSNNCFSYKHDFQTPPSPPSPQERVYRLHGTRDTVHQMVLDIFFFLAASNNECNYSMACFKGWLRESSGQT